MTGYVAPEVLSGNDYGKASDMWSMGVILFVLLSGCLPFLAKHQQELLQEGEAKYSFDPSRWKDTSESVKDLIKKLLVVDVSERLTVEAVLRHPWVVHEGGVSGANYDGALTR